MVKIVTAWNTLHGRLDRSQKWTKIIFQAVFQEIQLLCKALESSDVSYVNRYSKVRLLHKIIFYIRYCNEHNICHAI